MEVVKIVFIVAIITIDYEYIFVLGFLPRIIVVICIYIFSVRLKPYDRTRIDTLIHINNNYDEYYFIKNTNNKWMISAADFNLLNIRKYYGQESFIDFNSGIVKKGYYSRFMLLEFILVYTLLMISVKFLGLSNSFFILYCLGHAAYMLIKCSGKIFKTYSTKLNDQDYKYLVSLDRENNLSRYYVLYAIGLTNYNYLCNTDNKNLAINLRRELDKQ